MATKNYRPAAKTVLTAMLAAGALLTFSPVASADDPETPGQGQDACANDDQGQTQDPQACGAGIANRIVDEGKNAADQASQAADQANQGSHAADQAGRAAQSGDRPSDEFLRDWRCVIFNGVPVHVPPQGLGRTVTPFDSPMEGKSCAQAFGLSP